MTGITMRHITYKGTLPGLTDVASGNVSMEFSDLTPALPLIQAGKLKLIAVLASKRDPDMPDVPALAEVVPGYNAQSWQGFFARAGTPKPIVDARRTGSAPEPAQTREEAARGHQVRVSAREPQRRRQRPSARGATRITVHTPERRALRQGPARHALCPLRRPARHRGAHRALLSRGDGRTIRGQEERCRPRDPRPGRRIHFYFRETDAPEAHYDRHHVQIYLANFSRPYRKLLDLGLITIEDQ